MKEESLRKNDREVTDGMGITGFILRISFPFVSISGIHPSIVIYWLSLTFSSFFPLILGQQLEDESREDLKIT